MSTALAAEASASLSQSTPYPFPYEQSGVFESSASSSFYGQQDGLSASSSSSVGMGHLGVPGVPAKGSGAQRTTEERGIVKNTAARFAARLAEDHHAVLHPDVDTPFKDYKDVVARLLPYHVFQQPRDDLDAVKKMWKGKGKAKDEEEEIEETKFAIECYKRRRALEKRWKAIKVRSGKRSSPSDQALVLEQAVLEADRLDISALTAELRQTRAELDKIERAKRQSEVRPTTTTTMYHSSAAPAATSTPMSYYQAYPYAYQQAYMSSFRATPQTYASPATMAGTNPYAPAPPGSLSNAIPVQLPIALLPSLNALGIQPVPPPAPGQPAAAAVLRGSNGTMANLLFDVSLLQPNQMTGLAMMLNSLMATGINAHSSTPQVANGGVAAAVAGSSSAAAPPSVNGTNSAVGSATPATNQRTNGNS